MNSACKSFRSLLEQKLAGRPDPRTLRTLAWHEHLLGCGDCRNLLEREEALEGLLATLPDPRLPPETRRRVLAALARARNEDAELDRLLELDREAVAPAGLARLVLDGLAEERVTRAARRTDDPLEDLLTVGDTVDVPVGLAGSVLGGLAAHRGRGAGVARERSDAALDRLLERAGHVDVPMGLSNRVLEGLARRSTAAREFAGVSHARPPSTITSSLRPTRLVRSVWVLAAAAGLVAALTAWSLWPRHDATAPNVAVDGSTPRHTSEGPSRDGTAGDANRNGDGFDPNAPANRARVDVAVNGPAARSGATQDVEVAQAPDAQMLAAMDVLENWDYLMQNDVDVLLSTIEPADEALLDYQEGG